jgi:B9 domain-containing protein 2
VSRLDEFGRMCVAGYGFAHVPLCPGPSAVAVSCWRPTGSMQDELAAFFLGVTPQLLDNDVVFAKAWDQRCRLVTLPAGTVRLSLNVLLRHFGEHEVDVGK